MSYKCTYAYGCMYVPGSLGCSSICMAFSVSRSAPVSESSSSEIRMGFVVVFDMVLVRWMLVMDEVMCLT